MSHTIRILGAALMVGASLTAAPGLARAGAGAPGHGHGDAAIGAPAKVTAATRTVPVEMRDNAFTPAAIEVKAGEAVRFVVRNGGAFLHEFNIGTPEMHAAHRKEMAEMVEQGLLTATGVTPPAMATGTGHAGMPGMGHAMSHDDPNSVLVEPGQTRELTWTFDRAGVLEFACNIPGHYESGMVGAIKIVR